jgi:hypothetical protein
MHSCPESYNANAGPAGNAMATPAQALLPHWEYLLEKAKYSPLYQRRTAGIEPFINLCQARIGAYFAAGQNLSAASATPEALEIAWPGGEIGWHARCITG